MCGIFGLVDGTTSALFQSDKSIIWGMMLLTSMRGADATGLVGLDVKGDKVDYIKAKGTPFHLAQWKNFDTFSSRIVSRYNAVLGHGRAATIGEKTAPNAHPFQHGDITLIHNGTLRNFELLNKKHNQTFEVDSELLCWLINKYGIQETIDQIEGAYALAWWNNQQKTLNLLRNAERPLSYSISDNNKRLVFASEKATVAYACAAHKVDKFSTMKDLPVADLLTIKIKASAQSEIETTTTRIIKKYESSYVPQKWTGGTYFEEGSEWTPTKTYNPPATSKNSKVTICQGEDLEFNLVDYDVMEQVVNGKSVIILQGKYPEPSVNVEVIAKFFGKESELCNYIVDQPTPKFIGKVKDIRVLDVEKQTFRVFLEKAETSVTKETPKLILVPERESKSTTDVPLMKGEKISLGIFTAYQSKGCLQCSSELKYIDSHKMIRAHNNYGNGTKMEGLLCPTCSDIETKLKENLHGKEKASLS